MAVDHFLLPDRPPVYSHLILYLHLKRSLWPVVAFQSIVSSAALYGVLTIVSPSMGRFGFLMRVLALAALTALPFQVAQVMADVYTAPAILLLFIIGFGWQRLSARTHYLLIVATVVTITVHVTHLALAVALVPLIALLRLLGGAGRAEAARVVTVGAVVAALATMLFVGNSLAVVRKPVLLPHSSIFLLARLIDDGPALAYLKERCPSEGTRLCDALPLLESATSGALLWHDDSPFATVRKEIGYDGLRAEADSIVRGTLTTRPAEVLASSAAATWRQIFLFKLDLPCPRACDESSTDHRIFRRTFPGEYSAWLQSLQMRRLLPIEAIQRLHDLTLIASLLALLPLLALSVRRRDGAPISLAIVVFAALLLNALLSGALSGPLDRYQNRVIWLVPLVALAAIPVSGRAARQRDPTPCCANQRDGC